MNAVKSLLVLLSLGLVSEGVVSGEVGAPYPQLASTAELTVAVAETGASTSWVAVPLETKASARQMKELDNRMASIHAEVGAKLQKSIDEKFDGLIAPLFN